MRIVIVWSRLFVLNYAFEFEFEFFQLTSEEC